MGLEAKALPSSAEARRRGHSGVNFAAFLHMSVGRMYPGGRDADGGAGGGGQVKPADRELAGAGSLWGGGCWKVVTRHGSRQADAVDSVLGILSEW